MPSLPTFCCGPSLLDAVYTLVINPSTTVLVVGLVLVGAGFWMKTIVGVGEFICWTRNIVAYFGLALVMYYTLVKLVLPVQQLF